MEERGHDYAKIRIVPHVANNGNLDPRLRTECLCNPRWGTGLHFEMKIEFFVEYEGEWSL